MYIIRKDIYVDLPLSKSCDIYDIYGIKTKNNTFTQPINWETITLDTKNNG